MQEKDERKETLHDNTNIHNQQLTINHRMTTTDKQEGK